MVTIPEKHLALPFYITVLTASQKVLLVIKLMYPDKGTMKTVKSKFTRIQ